MPTEDLIGNEGPNNAKIGGVPTIYYFNFQSKGRGQVLRTLWEDAGIAYKDVRFSMEEYPDFKKNKLAELNPLATIPVVELNGRLLTQSYAILRHFSRILGAYDGKTEDEKYFVDLVSDIGIDWRTRFVDAYLTGEEEYKQYGVKYRQSFLKAVEGHLKSNALAQNGPYVLGNTITYADFVIYQVIHDDGLSKEGRKGLQDYPRLKQLVDAFEARPNVKAFLESDRYQG